MKKKTKIFIQKIVLVVTFALCFAIFNQTLSMVRNLWTLAIITETAKLCNKQPFITTLPRGDIQASSLEDSSFRHRNIDAQGIHLYSD